jgi:hypothetical protein
MGGKENNLYIRKLGYKAEILSETKGEEYKSEDIFKKIIKNSEDNYAKLINKETFLVHFIMLIEVSAGYLKILRFDKVEKMYEEMVKLVEITGQKK